MDSPLLRHNQLVARHGELRAHRQLRQLSPLECASFRELNGDELQR